MMYRDWTLILISFGVLMLSTVATICGLLAVAACVVFLVTEGQPGYTLAGLFALGLTCLLGAAVRWSYTSLMEEW
jgi:hypothetical protein